jgi:Ca2+-binding EF-hand superfamily protein
MFLRYIKIILKTNTQLEQAKENLFAHRTFNLEDCFRILDINKSGKVTAQELHQVF